MIWAPIRLSVSEGSGKRRSKQISSPTWPSGVRNGGRISLPASTELVRKCVRGGFFFHFKTKQDKAG